MSRSLRPARASSRISAIWPCRRPAPRRARSPPRRAGDDAARHGTRARARREHKAVGPWNPKLDAGSLRDGLRLMLLTRIYDERMLQAHRQGRISFYMQSTGEEAVAVAAGMALEPQDMLFPSYRCQGLYFLRGLTPVDLMCQLLSNTRDMCKGRQLPVMYHSAEKRLFSISGNLATQVPQAVGWAMAAAIKGETAPRGNLDRRRLERRSGRALRDGVRLDVSRAGDHQHRQQPVGDLDVPGHRGAATVRRSRRAGPGSGFPGIRVDGNDFLAVYAVTRWAAERARQGLGATLIELVTYRAAAHSTSDDPSRYRPKTEAAAWPLGDPIERLKNHLIALGEWSEERHEALARRARASRWHAAWKEACSYGTLSDAPRPDPLTMFDDVFAEMPEHLRRQQAAAGAGAEAEPWPQMNMIQALNSAMDVAMERDPSVVVMGEDVGYFGGVFRVHRRAAEEVRRASRVRYADRRRRHRRGRHRHGGQRPAPDRGNPVRGLRVSRLRPDRERARAPSLSQRRRVHRAGRRCACPAAAASAAGRRIRRVPRRCSRMSAASRW